jgi:hypothetical protein
MGFRWLLKEKGLTMGGSILCLSTVVTHLSTPFKDNFKALSSTFTFYPQKRGTPITTIFIYKYLSPQANLWASSKKMSHSTNHTLYAKLSNLEGVYRQTNEMRASA